MDKQNYTLTNIKRQEIKKKYKEIKSEILKKLEENRIIKRKRTVKDYSVLITAAYLYITENLSFQRLSDVMSCKYGISMSDTAWKKQMSKVAPVLLSVAMEYLHRKTNSNVPDTQTVYAIDATDISTEGGKGTAIRVHTQLSLTDRICSYSLVTDHHVAESVKNFNIEPNALYLADRAYGKTSQFVHMLTHGADFIFRISPSQLRLYCDPLCKERLDVKTLLGNSSFCSVCYFKHDRVTHPLRIIGIPIPQEKRAGAETRVRANAVKKQRKILPQTILYSAWVILATSLPDYISDDDILQTYRLRWQVELFFKREKQLLRFHKIRKAANKYLYTAVHLWLAVCFLISACQYQLLASLNFEISLFNSFSLACILFS